ncbi:MAG: ubiquinone/menaquinone biosynthesis methyltransferase [Candidatus Omnitrophica bacterium]|nr:ubiquinone/menaquinone biosynthesis methyltransferase [Candidatus Omnitrophota bacterium]
MTTRTASSPSPRTVEPKGRFIRRLFDTISPRYDRFNRVSSLGLDQPWRRRTIAGLKLLPGMRVLDLASGSGDLSVAATRELLPLGQVVACDLSYPMLRFARKKFDRHPFAGWHITLAQGKAEELPFRSGSFHAAAIGFALRNVSDLDATFRELYRVLKPGGRIGLLEFGRPNSLLFKLGHRIWLTLAIPLIGVLTTGKLWPFLYLRRSILQFLEPEQVLRRLEAAGFRQIKAEPMTGGTAYLYQAAHPVNSN